MAEGERRMVWQKLVHEAFGDRTLCGKYIGTMEPYQTADLGAANCPECLAKSKALEKKG